MSRDAGRRLEPVFAANAQHFTESTIIRCHVSFKADFLFLIGNAFQ
jgi:hypothetical protein